MQNSMQPLLKEDRFPFSCLAKLSCFNECCKDLNQFITPYDILMLKNHLGLSSKQFLERYTTEHIGPESGLPIITLKPLDISNTNCPFVTPDGCSVYESRPSSCRTYPLVRVIKRSRQTNKTQEHFMILKEPHCLGHNSKNNQSVKEWIENQGLAEYNKMNDKLMDIISLKNSSPPGPIDIQFKHMFRMACYDLDNFREHIFSKGLLDDFPMEDKTRELVKQDDKELLSLGLEWIKDHLEST